MIEVYECNSVSTDQVEVDIRWDLMSQESESEETVTEWWKHLFSSYYSYHFKFLDALLSDRATRMQMWGEFDRRKNSDVRWK